MISLLVASVIVTLFYGFKAFRLDHKTGFIPNSLTYQIVFFGIIFSLLFFPLNLVYALLVFCFCFVLYKVKAIGGGDVRFFTGLSLFSVVNPLVFFVVVLFSSYVLLLVYSVVKKNVVDQRFGLFIFLGIIIANVIVCFWLGGLNVGC